MNKILVSDYDRTFYLNDINIEENKKSVESFRNDNNFFIIATGRSYLDFNKKKELYNIKYDYLILNHGATILDDKDNILYNESINNSIINSLVSNLDLESSINNFFCSKLDSRVSPDHKNLTKINVKYETREKAKEVLNNILAKYENYINAYIISESSIEIISKKVSKDKAISFISNKLNINNSDIYTIGDGYSDIDMIKKFNGYCMKDSVKGLKDIAIKECESVSDLINEIK